MPGLERLNRGGNEGNRYGAGRKRNVVRAGYLKADEKGLRLLAQIIEWKPVIPFYGLDGKLKGKRPPTFEEWKWAKGETAKYGLGTKDEVVVLGSSDAFDAFADVLSDHEDRTLDASTIASILDAVGSRLNGEGE